MYSIHCIHKNLIFQFEIRQREEEQRTENNKQILSFLLMTFSDDMHKGEGERVEEITSIQQQIFCL